MKRWPSAQGARHVALRNLPLDVGGASPRAAGAWLASSPAAALDKVTFGTNWVAEGEHGGFYQALADGTYKKYGLDVTIVPGGPNANNRMLLLVDKLDFYLSANTLQGFDAVEKTFRSSKSQRCFKKIRRF